MPASVAIGLGCLLLAFILYSIGVWTAFRKKGFGTLQVVTLWLGVVFDVAATVSMGSTVGGLDLSSTGWLHTVLALVVMLGMILAASFGTAAYVKKDEKLCFTCSRYNVIAWLLWFTVFVWGLLTRMPAK
jgi:uncharacterized repeat protein (TIGR03987 family)